MRARAVFRFAVALSGALFWQPAAGQEPCEQIAAACEAAGFVRGGTAAGNGLFVDCIEPIMHGGRRPRSATKPLPALDPHLVTACAAQNPGFGRAGAAPPVAGARSPAQGEAERAPSAAAPPLAAGSRPNIVFVLTDDLATNLMQYMPHVREMQRRGVTFANYFVTDSLCCPSRSSIFTGRYPHNTGVFRNTGDDGGYLAFLKHGNEGATFATALAAAGYRTAMLGKYLNGYLPRQHAPATGWTSWAVAGNGYPEFNYALNQDRRIVRHGNQPSDYLTDVLSGLAVQFIRQSAGKPFMIEIATFAPHAPYTPAPRDAGAFPGLGAPRTAAFDAAPGSDAPKWLRAHPALTPADVAAIDRDFRKRAQSVLAVDRMIGELEAVVAAIGAEKNTYFVFSSDNGYHMGEHRLMPGKMTAYDTDIRVPLVVTGPDVPAGLTVDEVAENVDLCPTFAELGDARAPVEVDGRSLVPLLRGQKPQEWRSVALIEHHGPQTDPKDPDAPGIRSGNPTTYEAIRGRSFVYVEYADGEREYHDLAADPQELRNTFPALPDERKSALHATLEAARSCRGASGCLAAERANGAVARN